MGRKSYILGIDPGTSGALCLLAPTVDLIKEIWDFPLKQHFGHNVIDYSLLGKMLLPYAKDIELCVIEDVHSMPLQGVASTFSFGVSKGVVLGMVAAFQVPIFTPPPAVWKMNMGLTKDKAASFAKATELYPEKKNFWARKCDDGRAEAVLLAEFGRRFYQ